MDTFDNINVINFWMIKTIIKLFKKTTEQLWEYLLCIVVGRIMPPKDVLILIWRTHEYVTLHSKDESAGMIKVRDFEVGR